MRQVHLFISSLLAGLLASAWPAQAADGLTATADTLGPARWQLRVDVDRPLTGVDVARVAFGTAATPRITRLLGDYHLDPLRLGDTGHLRLTGGLWLSQSVASLGTDGGNETGRATQPYLGVGYTLGGPSTGWGLSADLGLTVQGLGNALGGTLSLGDALRELRWQPVLRLGVAYRF